MANEIVKKQDAQLSEIGKFFENTGVIDFFKERLGYNENELMRQALAFANKISIHDLEEKKPERMLSQTSGVSKQKVFMTLVEWGLPTDERDLYYLYNNGHNTLTCEPSYKGLIHIASKNGLEVHAGLIFKGDEFTLNESSEGDSYTIKRGNPFARKVGDIQGCYVYINNESNKPRIYTYSFEELEASRQASKKKMFGKESPAWANFALDMYLKAGIRKGIKIPLSQINRSESISALFNDEMPEVETVPMSNKTADLTSAEEFDTPTIDYIPEEYENCQIAPEDISQDEKQEKFAELKEQFGVNLE